MKKGKAPIKETKEFEEEVIQIDRVTRVVKGGRRLRFRATVAIGNKKGKVGVGVGKSTEVTGAIQKAISKAKKNLITVPMVNSTIPHKVNVKFKSAKMIIMPACPGTGIIAGGPLRKICELAGIKDVLAKCLGNNNKLNNSKATIKAFEQLKEIPWITKKQEVKKNVQNKKPIFKTAKSQKFEKPKQEISKKEEPKEQKQPQKEKTE